MKLVGIVTGYCILRGLAANIGFSTSKWYQLCDEKLEETVEYVLCHCSAHARTRLRTLGHYSLVERTKKHTADLIKFIKKFRIATRHQQNKTETSHFIIYKLSRILWTYDKVVLP